MGTLNLGAAGILQADKWENSDGTENYKCRAWVNFNGTGAVAIRASGNVSSITDNGTGDYTVNFTEPLPDANYAAAMNGGEHNSGSYITAHVMEMNSKMTTSVRVRSTSAIINTFVDVVNMDVIIFR